MNRIIGVDPGLNRTGWGIIEIFGSQLNYIASGVIETKVAMPLPTRLACIYNKLNEILIEHKPNAAAIEETYVNTNFGSSLKLAQARAAAIISLEMNGLTLSSYQAKQVKKAVTGYGQADKDQMVKMINMLLPMCKVTQKDAADAIAIAICGSVYNNLSKYA
jgi:crossover junction endodeoxyribonuclease RuvC